MTQQDGPLCLFCVCVTWRLRPCSSRLCVALCRSWHLGQLQVGLSRARRLVQCSHARITLSDAMPMQARWAELKPRPHPCPQIHPNLQQT